MARLPPATTRLSHPKASGPQRSGRNRRLARPSLLVGVVAVISSACIVSDPAEYGVAKQTPPFLNANDATPPVLRTRSLDLGEPLPVNVPLRSEDAGEELRALLFLDRGVQGKQQLLHVREIPPGKLEDKRTIAISAPIQVAGCHSVSLVVMHESSLDKDTLEPKDADDTAILTWWVNVDDDGTNLLSDCPVSGGGAN